MEHKTVIKFVKTSPKKLRFILDDVKKLGPARALAALKYEDQKVSLILYKAIKSAIDSAKKTLNVEENLLKFKILEVSQGPAFRRSREGGRGTAKPFKRRTAHIQIVLSAEGPVIGTPEKKIKKEEPKKLAEHNKSIEVKEDTKKTIKNSKTSKTRVTKAKK